MKTKTLREGSAAFLAGWTLACASGSASLISGTHQTLDINAQPPGAEVMLYQWNGEVVAGPIKAPASASVPRPKLHQRYLAVASKEGTCPRYWVPPISITPGGWVGLFVGFVSWIVDSRNGSAFKLDESEFNNIALQEEPCGH